MSLRHAVLGMLFIGPQSGYELAGNFERVLQTVWYARKNQMYGELAALTEAGFATVAEEGARGRRTYAVTPAGRAELRRWLVETEPDRTARSDTLLRAFLLPLLARDDALAVLNREADLLRARRDGIRAALPAITAAEGPTDPKVLGMELSHRLAAALLDWTEETTRRLTPTPPPSTPDTAEAPADHPT